jgi:hypothetical protein
MPSRKCFSCLLADLTVERIRPIVWMPQVRLTVKRCRGLSLPARLSYLIDGPYNCANLSSRRQQLATVIIDARVRSRVFAFTCAALKKLKTTAAGNPATAPNPIAWSQYRNGVDCVVGVSNPENGG